MHRIVLVLFLVASASGCIKLQMPDDLVSDTVRAGKDVYGDIKDSDDEEPAQDGADDQTTFAHTVVGPVDSLESDLRKTCLSELESRTREILESDDVTFTVVSESISFKDDKAIANCTVAI